MTGELTTLSVRVDGDALCINATTGLGGSITIDVLDEDGNVLQAEPPRTFADEIDTKAADLSAFCGRTVRFRFRLNRARLYAFRIDGSRPSRDLKRSPDRAPA